MYNYRYSIIIAIAPVRYSQSVDGVKVGLVVCSVEAGSVRVAPATHLIVRGLGVQTADPMAGLHEVAPDGVAAADGAVEAVRGEETVVVQSPAYQPAPLRGFVRPDKGTVSSRQ